MSQDETKVLPPPPPFWTITGQHWLLPYPHLHNCQAGHTFACFKNFRKFNSSGSRNRRAWPLPPALAVRPTRWMYSCISRDDVISCWEGGTECVCVCVCVYMCVCMCVLCVYVWCLPWDHLEDHTGWSSPPLECPALWQPHQCTGVCLGWPGRTQERLLSSSAAFGDPGIRHIVFPITHTTTNPYIYKPARIHALLLLPRPKGYRMPTLIAQA